MTLSERRPEVPEWRRATESGLPCSLDSWVDLLSNEWGRETAGVAARSSRRRFAHLLCCLPLARQPIEDGQAGEANTERRALPPAHTVGSVMLVFPPTIRNPSCWRKPGQRRACGKGRPGRDARRATDRPTDRRSTACRTCSFGKGQCAHSLPLSLWSLALGIGTSNNRSRSRRSW